jgi:chemotaxis response regulator CheB
LTTTAAFATPHDRYSKARRSRRSRWWGCPGGGAAEARSRVAELRPEVVLVDIALGVGSGFELARALARESAATLILISTLPEFDFVDLIAASPAVGFIAKSELSARGMRDLVAGDDARGARR